jgi:hypothetical protein
LFAFQHSAGAAKASVLAREPKYVDGLVDNSQYENVKKNGVC